MNQTLWQEDKIIGMIPCIGDFRDTRPFIEKVLEDKGIMKVEVNGTEEAIIYLITWMIELGPARRILCLKRSRRDDELSCDLD